MPSKTWKAIFDPRLSSFASLVSPQRQERERRESLGSRLIGVVNMKSHGIHEVRNFLPLSFLPGHEKCHNYDITVCQHRKKKTA